VLRFDWNYRTNRVKKTAASCQGLATHPNNPFTLASTSRDSTLRIWSLESLTQPLFMRVLAGEPCDSIVTPPGTKKTSCSACGSSVVDSCFRIFALEPFSRAKKGLRRNPIVSAHRRMHEARRSSQAQRRHFAAHLVDAGREEEQRLREAAMVLRTFLCKCNVVVGYGHALKVSPCIRTVSPLKKLRNAVNTPCFATLQVAVAKLLNKCSRTCLIRHRLIRQFA